MAKKNTRSRQGSAKSARKGRTTRAARSRPHKPAEAVTRGAPRSAATRRRARGNAAARRPDATAQANVTMTIDLGAGAPGDVRTIRRIDGRALAGSGTGVGAGNHTASWDVVSPTVRPIGFAVTISEDASGRKLLDRQGQKTGNDGRGAGAGTFTV